jgi:hypothetical protein
MTDSATPEEQPNPLASFTPVPRLTDRSDGWKPEIQRAFIEALADTGSVAAACRMVRRSTHSAYTLRRHPEGAEFAAAWAAAQGHGVLRLQDAVLDRALNGVEVPLIYHGEVVGSYRKYDERLAAFILRNCLPEQFGADRAPHAIDAKKLERLKKDWREEWQAERDAEEAETEAGVEDFVDQIAGMHVKWWSHCGPRTRAAYVHFRRLERIEDGIWLDEEADREAALAAAEAEYAEVFADDARSLAKKLGEICSIGDDRTWNTGEDDPDYT